MTTKHPEGPVLAALTVLCWLGHNVAAKHGIDNGFTPQALALLRYVVPGILAVPVVIAFHLRGKTLGVPLFRLGVLVALGGPIFGLAAVSGYVHAPLSHGLLFAPVAVFVMGTLLGRALLKERVARGRLTGAGVMFAGLATLVGFDMRGVGQEWGQGVAFFVLAGAMWGGYTVLLRLWRIPMSDGTLAVAAGSALVAILLLGPSLARLLWPRCTTCPATGCWCRPSCRDWSVVWLALCP